MSGLIAKDISNKFKLDPKELIIFVSKKENLDPYVKSNAQGKS